MAKLKYKANELIDRLKIKFSSGQRYVVLEQVCDGTGKYASSWIDAIVINLWPSEGCSRSAFEIKVNRNDFLNELKRPEKNAWAREYCHEFWYIGPPDVIKEEELPEGTGLMIPYGKGLKVIRAARRKEKAELDDVFLASLARSLQYNSMREKNISKRDLLKESEEHQRALRWEEETDKFLKSRGIHLFGEPPSGKDFERAVSGEKNRSDATLINNTLIELKKRVFDLTKFCLCLSFLEEDISEELETYMMQYGINKLVFEKQITKRLSKQKDELSDELINLLKNVKIKTEKNKNAD